MSAFAESAVLTSQLGEIPSYKVFESSKVYAFLDINPLSEGHTLIIPKYHGAKVHEIPDEYLTDIIPAAKKIALALGATPDDTFQYNLLQNNGTLAHQVSTLDNISMGPVFNTFAGCPACSLPRHSQAYRDGRLGRRLASKAHRFRCTQEDA